MTDDMMPKDNDIVKFLRHLAIIKGVDVSPIELQAADEIEQLRKENERLRRELNLEIFGHLEEWEK